MAPPADPARVVAHVSGFVQGVGFRWWVRAQAQQRDLRGRATNLLDGGVEVVLEGPRGACEDVVRAMIEGRAPGRVSDVEVRWEVARGTDGFEVG